MRSGKGWLREDSRRGRSGVFEEESLREICIKRDLEGEGDDGAMKRGV